MESNKLPILKKDMNETYMWKNAILRGTHSTTLTTWLSRWDKTVDTIKWSVEARGPITEGERPIVRAQMKQFCLALEQWLWVTIHF